VLKCPYPFALPAVRAPLRPIAPFTKGCTTDKGCVTDTALYRGPWGSIVIFPIGMNLMSAEENVHHLPEWLSNIGLLIGGGGIGAVLLAMVQKPWTKVEQKALHASASKEEAAGKADLLVAMTSTFTDVTGGLRQEIERLQEDAGELRQRAVQFETELRVALQRVNDLERLVAEKDAVIARLTEDLDRVRAERDEARARTVQQEGEIRQLNQLIGSDKRQAHESESS